MLPGFEQDPYSTNQNLFLGSAAHADFGADLPRLGLRFRIPHRLYSDVSPAGRSLRSTARRRPRKPPPSKAAAREVARLVGSKG
ncbi:hypothetical protein AB0F91_37440 [Amycolatopsis sp. NPDC023774]|uniref:hypothetical protein n=1 Tax=Amycolatopsis sp. NPDC023774 TaxID=3155015 RepID=UPI003410F634